MHRFRKAARVGIYVILGMTALLITVIIAGVPIAHLVYKSKVEAQIAAIQARGEPISQAELKPSNVPDEKNAAVVFDKIFAEMEKPEFEADNQAFSDFRFKKKRESNPGLNNDVRKALARNKHIFPMIEEALAMPECVFPVNWDEPFPNVEFPHFAKLRRVASVLFAHAVISAEDGKTEEAVRSLELMYLLSETIKDEPTLIGLLVRRALLTIASGGLQVCANNAHLNQRTARRLYDLIADIDVSESLAIALMGERAAIIDFFHTMTVDPSAVASKQDGDSKRNRRPSVFWKAYMYWNQFYYLNTTERWIELSREPYSKVKSLPESIKYPKIPRYALMTTILLPTFRGATSEESRARLAGDRIFLALAAYRDRHGGYPESLSELRERLGWEIPEDPFSGEDFIYRREENGFVLYSIGANLTDDQATPWDSEGPAPAEYRYTDPISGLKTADIVWRIER